MSEPQSKYRNIKNVVDGIKFDSKLESHRYGVNKWRVLAGEITGFERQVKYPLHVNGVLVCTYIADFVVTLPDGSKEVEDVKGVITREFRIKQKLMKAIYGIEIKIIKK